MITTAKCWEYDYQLAIANDDNPDGREGNVSCSASQDGQYYVLEVSLPGITQYESGKIELKNIQIDGVEGVSTADHSYDIIVAIPPRNLTITGLDKELEFTQGEENKVKIRCTAAWTRPAPTFHWSIENAPNYELMNYTVSANDVVEVDFDQAGYNFPGKGVTVTQEIELLIEPWFDGEDIKCRAEHPGYNSSYSEEEKETTASMTVKGPPVPVDETVGMEGEFKVGEPATLLIPFHAYPGPTSLIYRLTDVGGDLNVTLSANTSSAGRYTARGWRLKDENNATRTTRSSSREYYAILEVSELEKEDRDRVHTMIAFNELGNATYTFNFQNIEDGGMSAGVIAGIVIGSLAGVLLVGVLVILFIRHRNGKKSKKIKQERKRKRTAARENNSDPAYSENPGFQDVQLEVGNRDQ